MGKSPPLKPKKKTKKRIILVEKTPSPPRKNNTPLKPKKKTKKRIILVEKTPSPPKAKTFKKKLMSPKEKKIKEITPIKETDLKTMSINIIMPASDKKRYNEVFIDILGELGDILQRQGEPFKARAYLQAQETIMTYPEDIYNIEQLKGLKGIGKAIEGKLEEYIKTGSLKLLDKERLNPLNVLTRVYGIGPKKAKELIDKGINSIADLQKNENLLNDSQRIGLKYFTAIETRIPRSEIDEYKVVLEKIFKTSAPSGSSFEIVGSYRRGALTSGDIDIIITNKDNNVEAYTKFFEKLVKEKIVIEVLTKGKTKSLTIALLPDHVPRRVDFLYTSPKEYAFALLYFTGSKIFNTVQRQRALDLGYTLNEHGLNHMKEGKKGEPVINEFPDEKSIFAFLGMKYKEPQERKDGRAVQVLSQAQEQEPLIKPALEEDIIIKKKNITLKKKPTIKVDNLLKFKQEGKSALDLLTEKELSTLISEANEAYYCAEETFPIMTDNEYDVLREYTLSKYPKNKAALEGHTKCAVKIEKNKVKLPYEMWSMDKIKPSTDALTKWKQNYTGPYVISCKLDGISALYSTENKEPKLYTRGDGITGQDISHLIPHLKLPFIKGLVIRGEIIIKKAIFIEKYAKQFANPRNFVAGIVNKKTSDSDKYNDLSFVAYEVIKPVLKPSEQFSMLEDTKLAEEQKTSSLEVVKHDTLSFIDLTNERLSELLIKWREEYLYEIDGIICIDDKIYPRPKGNPPYAFAFKMVLSDQMAEAKVVDVIWTASKDGYLKPRVQIEPINLGGVTIEYATGFNAKFIVENNIGVGALIRLIRSGDVIPHITNVVQPASQPLLPIVPYEWNETKVDILLKNKEDNATVKEKTISGFFTNLEVDGLGPGNIKRMIEAGYDTVPKILALSEADLLKVEGFKTKLAHKIHTNIHQQLEKADLPELMHASNIFGRGFGTKKLKLILDAYPSVMTDPISEPEKIKKISTVEGMAKKTSEQFVKEIPSFLTFLQSANLQGKLHIEKTQQVAKTINKDHPLFKKKWVMTGFRDKELIEKLLSLGSEQGSSVNKKTDFLIVKDLDEDNVKVGEAKKLGIPIMNPEQVIAKYSL